jgi:hypothetical protein
LVAQRLNLQKHGQLPSNPLVLLYVRKNLRQDAASRNTPCNRVRRVSKRGPSDEFHRGRQ